MATTPTFYEFFAGAGMARAGLGAKWRCVFSNEFDLKKSVVYRKNWKTPDVLKVADVGTLTTADVPGVADLAWASFPCQDLSLAGAGAGLKGDRSGTFWPFWRLMQGLIEEGRAPKLIVLENVCGTLTSHGGKDFAAICSTFVKAGYYFGAVIVDAVRFVPHSRPRLFVIGVRDDLALTGPNITTEEPSALWHPRGLLNAYDNLSAKVKDKWLWWNPSAPPVRATTFAGLIEDNPVGVEWHTASETADLLKMMSDINREKVNKAKATGRRMVGTVYKRTRRDEVGRKVQRAEIRFDDIAGCLRTPAGGSSRQVIMIVDGETVRSRLISPRETARLMGLPDTYELPTNYNEAYHLTGDGVAVPVVRHLAQHIFEPLLLARIPRSRVAA
ncbi:MAG: DNA cytosine methyltransferase [Gammaproteobacteria bacterium]|nr:DNA cytosine methyltransferase [Gammaproteobacteria bacterium]